MRMIRKRARPAPPSYPNTAHSAVAPTAMEALSGADVLLIATEWKEFSQVSPADVARSMRSPTVFDGRSVFNVAAAREAGLTTTRSAAPTRKARLNQLVAGQIFNPATAL